MANIRSHPNPGMEPGDRQEVGLVTSVAVVCVVCVSPNPHPHIETHTQESTEENGVFKAI